MIKDIVLIALRNMSRRKLRSFLTILGVIIGVAAIVGMVGATQGINKMILKQIEKFQSDVIEVIPGELKIGFSFGFEARKEAILTEKDVEELRSLAGGSVVSSSIHKNSIVSYRGEKFSLTVIGIDEYFKDVDTLGLLKGRYPKKGKEVLIGYSVAYELFDKPIDLNKKIKIHGQEFRVVGIMNKAGGVFKQMDTLVYIPKSEMRKIFGLDEEIVSLIDIKVEEGNDPNEIARVVEEKLLALHKVSKENKDFTVISPEFSRKVTEQITSLMQALLGSIAGISLLVGAIGIANMMFTNVLERTREIGILKAIGATNRQIMSIFLVESGIIGFVGGILGIVLGYFLGEGFLFVRQLMISKTRFVPTTEEIPHISLSLELIVATLIFSFVIGLIAGLFPARRAARLQPIEALKTQNFKIKQNSNLSSTRHFVLSLNSDFLLINTIKEGGV
jgi:putative ABC transport system permease protein